MGFYSKPILKIKQQLVYIFYTRRKSNFYIQKLQLEGVLGLQVCMQSIWLSFLFLKIRNKTLKE